MAVGFPTLHSLMLTFLPSGGIKGPSPLEFEQACNYSGIDAL